MRILCSFLLLLSLTSCEFIRSFRTRSDEDVQRDWAAARLTPAKLAGLGPASALAFDPPREMTVRFLIDGEFRSQPRWEERLERLIALANEVLVSQIGVRLRLTSTGAWFRKASADSMPALLDEAQTLELQPQADVTVFLTGAAPLLTSNLHQLGRAQLLEPRFVLRAIDDFEEAEMLHTTLPKVDRDEVRALRINRVRHKQVVVFLHEWAHAFGAPHQKSPFNVLCDMYDREQRAFGPDVEGLLGRTLPLALDRALPADQRASRMREAVRTYLEAHPGGDWIASNRDRLLAYLQGTQTTPLFDEGEPVEAPPDPKAAARAPEGDSRYQEALKRARSGDPTGAWNLLRPLAEASPKDLNLQMLACQSGIQAQPKDASDPAAVKACERGALLAPKDPFPLLALAAGASWAGDRAGSLRHASAARALIEATGTPSDWKHLGLLYQGLDSPTLALAAFARTGEPLSAEVKAWERQLRRGLCLPTQAAAQGIGPEREWEYSAAMRRVRGAASEKEIEAALAPFPRSAGRLALLCDLESRRARPGPARRFCEAALAAHGDCILARATLGFIGLNTGALRLAKQHLELALDLDPSNSSIWQALAMTYVRLGDHPGLAALQARHQRIGGARPAAKPAK